MPVSDDTIVNEVREFYLASRDFNGIPASLLAERLKVAWPELSIQLATLVSARRTNLAFESHSGNPHIKRIATLVPDVQVANLKSENPHHVCIYPSRATVEAAINVGEYADRPYTGRLLLGEPQLAPVFFELGVLERYFRDPRSLSSKLGFEN